MKISAVILAAGKGTRMGTTDRPKVMFEANGKPLVEYLVNSIKAAKVEDVTLVVGYMQEMVRDYFKNSVKYVEQKEQLGTGHAVLMAKEPLQRESEAVITCYGDMPLFKTETIRKLIETFESEKPTVAMLTVDFKDPEFWAFGRIVRDENGEVAGIVEQKDCTPEQRKIKECNPSFFIFNSDFLWDNLENIKTNNSQGEYYLTDMIKLAKDMNKKIVATKVAKEYEVLGVNTPEQLKEVEEILQNQ
jgi:UDP-N-acetylglucosamine diphosphorylase/glucosamine-1-phosphate N-acetyltransferase